MIVPVLSLDMPRTVSHRVRGGQILALISFVVIVALGAVYAKTSLYPITAVGLLHAVMGAFVTGVTSLLMFQYANDTRKRGFLVIAVTYLYLACILLIFPLAFPGALVDDDQLLGNAQTPVGFFFAWHFAVPVGLSIACIMLYADERQHRRPGLNRFGVHLSGVLCLLGVALTVAVAAGWPATLTPDVIDGDGRLTLFSGVLKAVTLLLSLVFLGIALFCNRSGSVIAGWLTAVAVLGVGEALVSFNSVQRYTLGWYFSRLLWLVAVSVLLLALIRSLSRVAAANVAVGAVDSLTGAASRSVFLITMDREIARSVRGGEQVALLWLDLDRFKDINDQLGHEVGDDVLRRIVHRVTRHIGTGNTVGRLGGDEFGVLLCDATASQARQTAEALLDEIKRPISLSGAVIDVSAAIGIATAPADAESANTLLQCANLAMVRAKQAAGDRTQTFDSALGAQALARTQIRRDLATALQNGGFDLYYQPILHLADGRLAGAEALARWWLNGQMLPAGQWIPVAESSGQIVAVAHRLVACLQRDLPRLIGAYGEGFFATFNMSSRELADEGLVDAVIERLGPHAEHVLLEVTESLELQEHAGVVQNLDQLRQAGLRIAVDDFGTGYSNLTRLERLRPALLKTDRSLVRRAASDMGDGQVFLRAACALADSLGCQVVIEGVETAAEDLAARAANAGFVQGFRYGRPAPVEQLLAISA